MKTRWIITALICLFISSISGKADETPKEILTQVLANLEKIESAAYEVELESWQPYGKEPLAIYNYTYNEYKNPNDTTIGASFICWQSKNDTAELFSIYNGIVKVLFYHSEKEILIDDFTTQPLPFSCPTPPFYNYTKSVINYALTTNDSIDLLWEENGDHYHMKLAIYVQTNQNVEFFGKAYYINSPTNFEEPSVYELWIKKADRLPYKYKRELSHDMNVLTCLQVEFNKLTAEGFKAENYFPEGYEIKMRKERKRPVTTSNLTGKKAPDWTLKDMYEEPVSLSDYKSKVLLINFTGIGCGPCGASIPFLKKIKNTYATDAFDLVAIECWKNKPRALQTYAEDRYHLNYKLISGTEEMLKSYERDYSVPAFFILDEQRVIRKVLEGYNADSTDKEIRDTIEELLK